MMFDWRMATQYATIEVQLFQDFDAHVNDTLNIQIR